MQYLNKIAIACVTVWVQDNYHFSLPQNSIPLLKNLKKIGMLSYDIIPKPNLMKYNQSDPSFNIFTKFHQNPTHSNRDVSHKGMIYRHTDAYIHIHTDSTLAQTDKV